MHAVPLAFSSQRRRKVCREGQVQRVINFAGTDSCIDPLRNRYQEPVCLRHCPSQSARETCVTGCHNRINALFYRHNLPRTMHPLR